MKHFENDHIYDLETYPNLFSMCVISADGKDGHIFEISDRKDNRELMFEFLDKWEENGARLVGFNNLAFDYPILHYIMENRDCTVDDIYKLAQKIIKTLREDRFAKVIKDTKISQVDLFKLNHFDNAAKMTSLKVLQFNMKMDNLQELPYPFDTPLTKPQMQHIIEYNANDVVATLKFYYENIGALELRKSLSEKYNMDFTNASDSKIGGEIFIQELERVKKGSCYSWKKGRRTIRQTKRKVIHLREIILPYIKFERPEFQAILDWFKVQSISETKGVFSDILESDLYDVANYANLITKKSKKLEQYPTDEEIAEFRKEKPLAEVLVNKLKSGKESYYFTWNVAKSLNVVIEGHEYVFGVGGIHSSEPPSLIESNEEYIIIDLDVASYYPNLAIKNELFPKHLSNQFCKTYEALFEERKTHPKGSPENSSLKLALNATYGNSNNQYSPFYDPQYTMAITVNGQLSLCMLLEQILKLDGATSVQSNTDGITFRVKRSDADTVDRLTREWEDVTQLEMERNDYSKMYIRDVNNYVAVYEESGKSKSKGAYEISDMHHKNQSMKVVQKAVEAYLTYGTPVKDFIMNHDDKYDFMLRVKLPKIYKLVSVDDDGVENREQNVTRYYVSDSEKAKTLIKIMPPLKDKIDDRRGNIQVGRKTVVCNEIADYIGEIDYDYYIEEAKKLVDIFTVDTH